MSDVPILMGEAPSKSGDRYHMVPLSGRVAEALCKLAGISPQEEGTRYGVWTWALYEHFECMNLIRRWPGAQGHGSAFPMGLARQRAAERLHELDGRVIVLLGARLPKVVGTSDAGFYEWRSARFDHHGEFIVGQGDVGPVEDVWAEVEVTVRPRARVVAIPHPSGLNRLYNAEWQRAKAGEVLRHAMELASQDLQVPTS